MRDGDREFARRGIGLDQVLRGVRFGLARMARAFMAACDEVVADEARAQEMQNLSAALVDYGR